SMTWRLTYQSFEQTLTDEQVQQVHQEVIKHLESKLGARMRS
ncbi:MAG TPA: hypothetical protein ENN77_02295, partial [Candidatus Wirthbacteria bacterium]|nr:hypothetical protein [Candidatus Wirthbacteria bacterium]